MSKLRRHQRYAAAQKKKGIDTKSNKENFLKEFADVPLKTKEEEVIISILPELQEIEKIEEIGEREENSPF